MEQQLPACFVRVARGDGVYMTLTTDVVVVGGGVVGMTAALAMHLRGFVVSLVDASTCKVNLDNIDRRVYALNRTSIDLFVALGVWQVLEQSRVSPYEKMHIWDAISGKCLDFDARLVGEACLGVIVEEAILKQALLQRLGDLGVQCLFDSPVREVEVRGDKCLVQAGAMEIITSLLIVADGANSIVRELLRVPIVTKPYYQDAIVATVQTEKVHQRTAYQVFHP